VTSNRITSSADFKAGDRSRSVLSAPNRKKGQRKKSDKSSGGQKSHIGTTLQKIEEPDEIEIKPAD
jgi:transposase